MEDASLESRVLSSSSVSSPVDLHTHSTASDGSLPPAQVIAIAAEAGVSAIALTDHDTTGGLAEAEAAADKLGVDFLTGIEVTAAFPRPGTMHLLGYGFDPKQPAMCRLVRRLGEARDERVEQIVRRLRRVGVEVSVDEVRVAAGGGSVGRPHVAKVLVERGYAVSQRDAFDRYLGGGGAAYVDTAPLASADTIAAVRAAGGLVSLAHPLQLRRASFAQLEALVRELTEQGMEGLETLHSTHDPETSGRLTRLADRLELLCTGGSDYHGPHKPWIKLGRAGGRAVQREMFDALVGRLRPAVQPIIP